MVAFLRGIPQDVLAKASLRSKAYTRALMHFEAYILENKENIQDHLTFLQVRQSLRCISLLKCVLISSAFRLKNKKQVAWGTSWHGIGCLEACYQYILSYRITVIRVFRSI